jgi:ankyrin repeat protein
MRWDTVIFEACDGVDLKKNLKKLTKALKRAGSDWLNENEILERGMWSMPVLEKLLQVPGIDVNQPDGYGWPPLWNAMREGRADIVEALLQAPGIDSVNALGPKSQSLLVYAIADEEFDVVRVLLQADGIDVNIQDGDGGDGYTPLMVATGHVDIMKLLLRFKDIRINIANYDGRTALSTAVSAGNVDAVRLLLRQKDIDVNHSDNYGQTALSIACEHSDNYGISEQRYVDCVHLLLRHKDINVNHSDNDGKTAMYSACEKGSLNTVNALLNFDPHDDDKYDAASFQTNQSVDINKGPGEFTPLDIAIKHEHWDIVVRLEDIPGTKKPSYKHNEGYIRARNKATAHDAKLKMIANNIASKSKTPGAGDLAAILGRSGHFLPKPVESTYMQFVKKRIKNHS